MDQKKKWIAEHVYKFVSVKPTWGLSRRKGWPIDTKASYASSVQNGINATLNSVVTEIED